MPSREEIIKSLEGCMDVHRSGLWSSGCAFCSYAKQSSPKCFMNLTKDAIALLKEQNEIIDALLKVGYPHNFQREPPWIVNYMSSITDVVRKAVHLRNGEVKQDD